MKFAKYVPPFALAPYYLVLVVLRILLIVVFVLLWGLTPAPLFDRITNSRYVARPCDWLLDQMDGWLSR